MNKLAWYSSTDERRIGIPANEQRAWRTIAVLSAAIVVAMVLSVFWLGHTNSQEATGEVEIYGP